MKRYIYERAGIEEPFGEVPQEVYRDIAVDSFRETYTPKSMNPTSTKLPALVNNKARDYISAGLRASHERGGCFRLSDKGAEGAGF